MKHVTFIRPNMCDMRSSDAMEPLAFAIIAARTPPDIEIAFHDERLESVPLDAPTDLLALTVETFTARRAYEIAAAYRRRGVPVVMGGYHPTLLAEEALQHCDAVVLGDAEGVWEEVVRDARAGRLRRVYRQTGTPSLLGFLPRREIFAGKRYAPLSLVQFGRGCRFACDFCSIHAFYGRRLLQRSVEDVVAEIAALPRRPVFIVDDNIFSNEAAAEALFSALIPLKIRWTCQTSIDITRHDRLLALMAQSGCFLALIGFESLNERNLTQMRKKWNLQRGDYITAIRKLHDHGIAVYGTFVFGYDHDTPAAFDATLEFAIRSRLYLANFNPLTPTPGTALYERLQRERRMLYEHWWLDPDYRYGHATFVPRGMTPEELTEGCYHTRTEFYGYGSILRRLSAIRWTQMGVYPLGVYLLSNLISRREILRKQDITFGGAEPIAGIA